MGVGNQWIVDHGSMDCLIMDQWIMDHKLVDHA